MLAEVSCFSPDEIQRNAECLLGHIEAVQGYLRWKGFSGHAIDHAVTVVYCAAMPYITGTRHCEIRNCRAWVFKVAINAAIGAARREVRCRRLEPAMVAAPASDAGDDVDGQLFDIVDVLGQLTELQSEAVELCWIAGMSQRDAAKRLGIAVGTLCRHLKAAKERLKEILGPYDSRARCRAVLSAGAQAS